MTPEARSTVRVEVCALADLPLGAMCAAEAGPTGRLIVANVSGELRAFDGICTHAYAELDKGYLRNGAVMCPLHFSEFDTRTGEALNPPAEEPLATYPVRVEGGKVVVEVPA